MTVIAALDCNDHVLMAADSMVTEAGGIRRTTPKMAYREDKPLVWGWSGDEGIGRDFDRWMTTYQWSESASWQDVADAAIAELSRLNGKKRQMAEIAHVKVEDNDLTVALLAGVVGGVLDIWELTDRGGAASVRHAGMAAIGSGHPHAAIAYFTLKHAQRDHFKLTPSTLGFIVEVAARMAPMCGLPIRMLRVDANGVHDGTAEQPSVPSN